MCIIHLPQNRFQAFHVRSQSDLGVLRFNVIYNSNRAAVFAVADYFKQFDFPVTLPHREDLGPTGFHAVDVHRIKMGNQLRKEGRKSLHLFVRVMEAADSDEGNSVFRSDVDKDQSSVKLAVSC